MKQKIFTLFLALFASAGTIFAQSGTCGDNLTWNLTNGVLTISGTGEMMKWSSASNVPWYSYRASISSVSIPNSITNIGDYAFYKCTSLTTINIPSSVISIGDYAFYDCSGLTSITIPNSVTSIGWLAFAGCSGLTSIVVENDNTTYDSRDNCNAIIETATNILISGCQNTIIPNSVTGIGVGAFDGRTGLTSVTIPDSVTVIRRFAFSHTGLTSVTIPNSVTYIDDEAFRKCTSLTSVVIGNSVTIIGWLTFDGCTGLTSITCEAVVPPSIWENEFGPFYSVNKSVPLYVPAGSIAAYQKATGWRKFTNIQAIASTEDPCSNPQTTIAPPIFECDSYYWLEADTMIYNSGEYTHTFPALNGCDSIVTLHATIVHLTESVETYYGCDYIIVRGRTYFTSGLYMDTLVNAAGCDSIILMDITISTSFNVIAPPVTAEGSYYWAEADTTITTSGIYTHNFYSWFGCDSVVMLDVTILEPEPGNLCDAPTELRVANMYNNNAGTVSLSWNGTAASYEVKAYSYELDQWYGPKIVNGTQTSFNNMSFGLTDFYVRAICGENEYSSEAIATKLLYYSDLMAVDYLDLDNAICYVNNSTPTDTRTFNDFRQVPAVNYGPSDINSRHTIHYDRNETDLRTGGMAKTVPDGELASVRLGNWDSGAQAERIEFSFTIDTLKSPVLLLKYLPIFEAPEHDASANPRIKVDLLINGQSLGRGYQLDINANDVYTGSQLKPSAWADGWHITSASVAQTAGDIVWKEWTTIGFNLRNRFYQGKTLTVRITSFDCAYSAHCGYVYFTLGVSDGRLMDMNCGQINPELKAPDGFNYRWMYASNEKYRQRDGSIQERYILSRSQTFNAGMQDDSLYVVDCMFAQDSTCFFSLYATPLATEPVAKMNRPQIVRNEQNNTYEVTFDASLSYVQEIDHVTGDTLVSRMSHIESYEWNVFGIPYGWSDDVSPTYTFPDGGIYEVTLRVTSGTCESLLQYNLQLQQDTGETIEPTDSIYDVIYIDQAGLQLETEPVTLHLPVAPQIEGFTFLKWQVVAGDLENGIYIQAVYAADEPASTPAIVTNPANPAQKLIRDGNVYILTEDKIYSITGQTVR